MKIQVETFANVLNLLDEFNKLDLRDIQITEFGEPIDFKDCLDDWKFIGLSNTEFVRLRFWENYNG